MKLQIGMDSMLKLLREFINQTGFAVRKLHDPRKLLLKSGNSFASADTEVKRLTLLAKCQCLVADVTNPTAYKP